MNFGIFLAFLCCVSAAYGAACCYDRGCKYTEGHNGRFTCAAGDVNKKFRNNNDPTKYWECKAAGQPAVCAMCQAEYLFSETAGDCVCFADWVWTAPCDPTTMIAGASGCEACVVPGTGTGTGAGCCGSGSGSGSGTGGGSGSGSGTGASCGCQK